MNVKLNWRRDFQKIFSKKFRAAQNYVDEECIKRMEPYVPVGRKSYHNAGKLKASVKIEKPGKIVYTAPFARHDYYSTVSHLHGGNPDAQRMWFEVMKQESGRSILKHAAEIAGGKAKK